MTRCLVVMLLLAACGDPGPAAAGRAAPPPAPAASGIAVAAGASLQAAIDAAPDGAVLSLLPGRHRGPVRVDRAIAIEGPRSAEIHGDGTGSTVHLTGRGARLRGCAVVGSGQRFDLLDSGVRVEGEDIAVEDVEVREALFGILVQLSRRAIVRGNRVLGTGQRAMGLRGDGIRLWETTDSVVADNVVRDCRDVVVWYSSGNEVCDNEVSRCRYGTHFMYSHDNVVTGNRYVDDVVGVFVMYSRGLQLRRNLLARAGGSAGIGLGVKESGDLTVEDNWFVQDSKGIHLDTSPLDLTHHNRFAGNVVRLCDVAVSFHASTPRNEFTGNLFADNGSIVEVGGQGDALACRFHGNYYGSYRGYDLDGDGRGDVPFEFRRLSNQLQTRHPELSLLRGSPAMQLVDLAGELLPLFAPRALLRDDEPLLHQPTPRWRPDHCDN